MKKAEILASPFSKQKKLLKYIIAEKQQAPLKKFFSHSVCSDLSAAI